MNIIKLDSAVRYGANTYVIINDGRAAVVDPTLPYEDACAAIPSDVTFDTIILTHAHFDHMLFLEAWKRDTGAELLIGKGDEDKLTDAYGNCSTIFRRAPLRYSGEYRIIEDGEQISLSDARITVMALPGHTEGSIALSTDAGLIVGDTAFGPGVYGRTDLPGGSYHRLLDSLMKLRELPENTLCYPGHGEKFILKEII